MVRKVASWFACRLSISLTALFISLTVHRLGRSVVVSPCGDIAGGDLAPLHTLQALEFSDGVISRVIVSGLVCSLVVPVMISSLVKGRSLSGSRRPS